MDVSNVNNGSSSNVSSFDSTKKTQTMGKQEFLNLLVTQLRYQDPLNPMQDSEFVAQLAQFSALEQMQNLNDSFELMKAQSLIGRYIVATNPSDSTKTIEGRVDHIKADNGKIYLDVDGTEVEVSNIKEVYHTFEEELISNIFNKIPSKDDLLNILNSLQKGDIEDVNK